MEGRAARVERRQGQDVGNNKLLGSIREQGSQFGGWEQRGVLEGFQLGGGMIRFTFKLIINFCMILESE